MIYSNFLKYDSTMGLIFILPAQSSNLCRQPRQTMIFLFLGIKIKDDFAAFPLLAFKSPINDWKNYINRVWILRVLGTNPYNSPVVGS